MSWSWSTASMRPSAQYEKLGFQVQPRGFHTKLGTANHLMIFDKDYFEILGIVEDTPFNAERREWLKDGGGLANVALATDGADLAFDAFKAARPQSRCAAVLRPRGRGRRQDRARPVPHRAHPQDQHAGGRLLRLRAPDAAVRLSRRMGEASQRRARHRRRHRDRRAAGEVDRRAGEVFRRRARCRREGEGLVADTGTQPIRYLTRKDYAARYPGITPVRPGDHPALLSVRVDSLAACEALLAKNGVKTVKPDAGRLLVPPSEAAHLTIEFVQ